MKTINAYNNDGENKPVESVPYIFPAEDKLQQEGNLPELLHLETWTDIHFDPEKIFYAADSARYYIDAGTHYRPYSKQSPVRKGIFQHFKKHIKDTEMATERTKDSLDIIERGRAVDWAGALAGYRRGMMHTNGRHLLITSQANLPEPTAGDCPIFLSIIKQAFPEDDARNVFLAWLKGGWLAIKASVHQPAPMLVLAGEPKAGKSLLAFITKNLYGGRSANPMTAWNGNLVWNDNLLAAELLLVDDSEASTDIRSRRKLGARFKESIYADAVEIHTRRKTSLSMRPVWRVMLCCNKTPENLSVIPPLEDGIEDKIILLECQHVTLPFRTVTANEKDIASKAILTELPAIAHFLEQYEIPDHLVLDRDGVIPYKDKNLLHALNELSPEDRLESILQITLEKNELKLVAKGETKWFSAIELETHLKDFNSFAKDAARQLLTHANCTGRYLSALHKKGSPYVTNMKIKDGRNLFEITHP